MICTKLSAKFLALKAFPSETDIPKIEHVETFREGELTKPMTSASSGPYGHGKIFPLTNQVTVVYISVSGELNLSGFYSPPLAAG
jgi:hypothetical protein